MGLNWRRGDTEAFNATMKAGQGLRDMWDKYQLGQAYKDASQVTQDYGRDKGGAEEFSYTNEEDAKRGAASAAARAELRANYDVGSGSNAPRASSVDAGYDAEGYAATGGLQPYKPVGPVELKRDGMYRLGGENGQQYAMRPGDQAVHRAGLEGQKRLYAGRGDTDEAMKIQERIDAQETGSLQRTAAQDSINRGRVADSDKAAYKDAIQKLPEVGSYTLDGKVVPKGTEGAKEVTHFDYANGMRLAAAAGGDHAAAGVWGEKAGLHLANQTAMKVMKATSLDDINKGAYGDFTNGKDFVETKNKDGSVSYGHKGEPPVFTASKFDPNPFATFKESLATTALKDPKATLDFHDKTRAMNMKGQELSATLELKKAIAGQTAQAHAAGNEVRKLVAQGAVDARNDAIEARRGQFMAQAMEKWGAANEPPTADPKTKEGRTTIAAWEKKRDDHLEKLMSNYDAGVSGKAPQRGAKPVNLSPPALDEPTGGLEVSSLDRAVKSQTGWGPITPEAMLQRGVQLGVPGAIAEAEARERRLQPQTGMPLGDPNYVPG